MAMVVSWRRRSAFVFAVGLLLCHAHLMRSALETWQSDLTVWAHAVQIAPFKPRVALNYGVVLLQAKAYPQAVAQLIRAERLTHAGHVPAWDRAITRRAAVKNLTALGVIR